MGNRIFFFGILTISIFAPVIPTTSFSQDQKKNLLNQADRVAVPTVVDFGPVGRSLIKLSPRSLASAQESGAKSQAAQARNAASEMQTLAKLRAEQYVAREKQSSEAARRLQELSRDESQLKQSAIVNGAKVLSDHSAATASHESAAVEAFSRSAVADAATNQEFSRGFGDMMVENVRQVGETQRELLRTGAAVAGTAMGMPVGAASFAGSSEQSSHTAKRTSSTAMPTKLSVNAPLAALENVRVPMPNGETVLHQPALSGKIPELPDCKPVLDPKPSLDSRLLTFFGFDDTSCCGASRHCEKSPESCFPAGSQERVCRDHDANLGQHSAWDATNPTVYRAHKKGTNDSTSWPVRFGLEFMRQRGLVAPSLEQVQQSGMPLWQEPAVPPEG